MNKWGVGLTFLLAATSVMAKDIQLLNVSYDPTRELYEHAKWHLNRSQFGIRIDHDLASISDHS
ncbi:hypothetical protein O5190_19010, partial [Escherichia coli]|nr:hypothetical protein [Escherichia coli]